MIDYILGAAFGSATSSTPNRCNMSMIEVTDFDAIVEQHSVPLPVETICEQDMTLCSVGDHSNRRAIDFDRCADSVPLLQIDLIGMGLR